MSEEARRVITTVTLNPAIDEAIVLESFVRGAVNRCEFGGFDPGGKGINASRVVARLGFATLALGFAGGVTGDLLRERLDREGVPNALDAVPEMTRLNIMFYERRERCRSRLYLPGARVEPEQLDSLKTRLSSLICARGVAVLGGSVPPGLPHTVYRDLVLHLRQIGARTVVDTSGAALLAALEGGPDLIKPNVEEAAEVLGRSISGDGEALSAARRLCAMGAKNVVISQGEDGAVAILAGNAWKAYAPRIVAQSTVGSGDSMVAGIAIGLNEHDDLAEGLRLGTAAGAATALSAGTHLCTKSGVESLLPSVVLTRIEAAA